MLDLCSIQLKKHVYLVVFFITRQTLEFLRLARDIPLFMPPVITDRFPALG